MEPIVPDSPVNTSETKVSPDDPVITIHKFCSDPPQPENCSTVVTRAQFEKLAEALQPGMSVSLKLNVANAYARNLAMSAAAEKRGLDKTSAFEEEMRFAHMQLLAQDLTRALRAEADNISDADFADYYQKTQASLEEATVARIFVPRAKQSEQDPQSHRAGEDPMAKFAAGLRERAIAGEDPDSLQIEAYTAAGFDRTTPSTKMENVRRSALPPRHESVFELKPGDVSEVFSDPGGARFIYKMISKRSPTLEEARPELRSAISSERFRASMKPFENNAVFSDAYFNPPAKPGAETQKPSRRKPR